MKQNILRSPRVSLAIYLIALLSALAGATAAEQEKIEQSVTNKNIDNKTAFIAFVTNCPPISSVLLEYYLNGKTNPTIYEFCYQSNAFFGRQLARTDDVTNSIYKCIHIAGFSDKKYWSYGNSIKRGIILETCTMHNQDRTGGAWSEVSTLKSLFAFFRTCGLDGSSTHTIRCDDGLLHPDVGEDAQTRGWTGHLIFSNGIVVGAMKTVQLKSGISKPFDIEYRYNPEVAQYPIPAEIRVYDVMPDGGHYYAGLIIKLINIRLGISDLSIAEDKYLPFELPKDRRLTHIVWTNRANYSLERGQLFSMDPREAQRSLERREMRKPMGAPPTVSTPPTGGAFFGKHRTFFVIGIAILSALLLVIVIRRAFK